MIEGRPASAGDVTRLLQELGRGEADALGELLPLVYEELRALASTFLRDERGDHTLQPTSLVHEAYLRLVDQRRRDWASRQHFMAVAGMAMRRVLVNHARDRRRLKRGGGRRREPLEAIPAGPAALEPDVDLPALDAALTRLGAVDERKVRIVELRYFLELSVDDVADVLGISPATVKRDWTLARAWLLRALDEGATAGGETAP